MTRLHEIGIELEVPLHDVDLLGIVWHGNYYKYMEHGRTALMRSRGLDEPDLRELGVGLVISESRCRHTSSLRYGDKLRVDAWFRSVTDRIVVGYRIRNITGQRGAARAHTTLVTTDPHGNMLREIPDEIVRRIRG